MESYRTHYLRILIAAVLIAGLGSTGNIAAAPDPVSITIATGRVGNLYYPIGGALCKLINENRAEHGITCTVQITSGSVENIEDLRIGVVQFALAQSDMHRRAFFGTGPFERDGPFDTMRSVFAVYVEHFTVVAAKRTGVRDFEDLKGKRIYMGPPGSGRRLTMQRVMKDQGWSADAVTDVSELTASNQAQALCDGEFDAFVTTTGHPNPSVREVSRTCDARMIGVPHKTVAQLVEQRDFYVHSVVPRGVYREQSREVPTLGLIATLVTSAQEKPDIVYQVVKVFFENLDRLKLATPVFSSLDEKEMASSGLTAPLHEGAEQYFAETGRDKR